MTSGSLYFKLLKEDFKRRTWAIALVFLTFFFALPINLAITMENAAKTDYYAFNNYQALIQDGTIPDILFQEMVLALKTKVVMSQAAFGSGIVPFFLVLLAVVIGVSSFSYLHNRRKIDLYHSIPVRRETLYAAQFTGGILIVGLCYLLNLLLMMCVALSYGVSMGSMAGAVAAAWALNMLYFMLMYAAVAVAMVMTGNIVVGVLASGIFFFFMPLLMMVLNMYCETFFITSTRNMWGGDNSPFMWGMKYLSPFGVYMTAIDWGIQKIGRHVPEVICTVLGFLAISLLGMQLYRRRPSEAAGRAMAFKGTMSPIRLILVLGSGLAGGLFFWALQSRLKWGLFGVVVSVILAHCVIEIIYHFDFKKLFGNKLQLGLCLAGCVLLFLSFRYDWYGFDSYLPDESKIASASLELDIDSGWLDRRVIETDEDGKPYIIYRDAYEDIEQNMRLTDLNLVMPIVKAGCEYTLMDRETRLEGTTTVIMERDNVAAQRVNFIGGADGPTSVFVAGKAAGEETGGEVSEPQYMTRATVCYRMKNGREIRRTYSLYLSEVMDTYQSLYGTNEYKEGLYPILTQTPDLFSKVYYKEAGSKAYTAEDSAVLSELLNAYQTDLRALDVQTRMKEAPIGALCFVSKEAEQYLEQMKGDRMSERVRYEYYTLQELEQKWPVYPSYTNTIQALNAQGAQPGSYFDAEHVTKINISVQSLFYNEDSYSNLPEGDELASLQRLNPYYTEDGYLKITDPNEIRLLMDTLTEEEYYRLVSFQRGSYSLSGDVIMDNNATIPIILRPTPEIQKFFTGLPAPQTGEN